MPTGPVKYKLYQILRDMNENVTRDALSVHKSLSSVLPPFLYLNSQSYFTAMSHVLGFKSVLTTKARKVVNYQCSHINLAKQIINSGYTVERKKKSNLKKKKKQKKSDNKTGHSGTYMLQDI